MTEAEVASQFTVMHVDALHRSPDNPRKKFDPVAMQELTANVRANGIIEPIVVREVVGVLDGAADQTTAERYYEIVAGERRWRAAKAAGPDRAEVPVRVMQLSDNAALEIMLSENLQRRDIHPLEEAQGLKKLISQREAVDVEETAKRLGVTARYIYDRVRLLRLSPDAKKLFLADKFPLRHAILLSGLALKDQERALDVDKGGMFSRQLVLTSPGEPDAEESLKHNSAAELQSWIAQHVRLDPAAEGTAELYPEMHQALAHAVERVVHITYLHQVSPEVMGEGKILGPKTWKPADPVCPQAAIGVVVIGPNLGKSLRVCYDRKRCSMHWAAEQREARLKAADRGQEPSSAAGDTGKASAAASQEKAAREAEALAALNAAVAKETLSLISQKLCDPKAKSDDARRVLAHFLAEYGSVTMSATQYLGGYPSHSVKALEKLPIGDLVTIVLVSDLRHGSGQPGVTWGGGLEPLLLSAASALSIDVKKVRKGIEATRLKEQAVAEQAKKVAALPSKPKSKPAAAKAKKKSRK